MKNLFNRYSINSIQIEGTGVDRFIYYMEHEDGTPLNESEMDELLSNYRLHQDLLGAKLIN